MLSEAELFNKLLTIRDKYNDYFSQGAPDIFAIALIIRDDPASIHCTARDVPFELASDIEEIFWVD